MVLIDQSDLDSQAGICAAGDVSGRASGDIFGYVGAQAAIALIDTRGAKNPMLGRSGTDFAETQNDDALNLLPDSTDN